MTVEVTTTIVSVCKKNGKIVLVTVHSGSKFSEEPYYIVQRLLEKY